MEGKKLWIQENRASPPSFQEWRPCSKLTVSARCKRCSRVSRGRMVERPMPSSTLVMWVRGSAEFAVEDWRSRENWARRWLTTRAENPPVSEKEADSVVTSSSPLSLRAELVIGLDGSKKTL